MTRHQLPPRWQEYLSKIPETGMGYHLVHVTFADQSTVRALVLNGILIDLPDDAHPNVIQDIQV